jgi:hypothetical protein
MICKALEMVDAARDNFCAYLRRMVWIVWRAVRYCGSG